MQHRLFTSLLLTGLLWLGATTTVSAQFNGQRVPVQRPFGRPVLSPYLNLLRGGDPASNYYLGVVGQRRQRVVNQQLQSEIFALDRGLSVSAPNVGDVLKPLGRTGHGTAFMTYGNYYGQGVGPLTGATRFVGQTASQRRPGQ